MKYIYVIKFVVYGSNFTEAGIDSAHANKIMAEQRMDRLIEIENNKKFYAPCIFEIEEVDFYESN